MHVLVVCSEHSMVIKVLTRLRYVMLICVAKVLGVYILQRLNFHYAERMILFYFMKSWNS